MRIVKRRGLVAMDTDPANFGQEIQKALGTMALPFLPGNSFDKNVSLQIEHKALMFYDSLTIAVQLGKTRFHKSHCFDYRSTVPVFEEEKPGIGELEMLLPRISLMPGYTYRWYSSPRPTGKEENQHISGRYRT